MTNEEEAGVDASNPKARPTEGWGNARNGVDPDLYFFEDDMASDFSPEEDDFEGTLPAPRGEKNPVAPAVRASFQAPPTAWDSETAAEAGRKSGEARRRKSTMSPEERALDAIGSKLSDLTSELIDAALGKGDFTDLKLETRVTALQRLMEWRLGRPASVKPKEDLPAEPPATGEDLFS